MLCKFNFCCGQRVISGQNMEIISNWNERTFHRAFSIEYAWYSEMRPATPKEAPTLPCGSASTNSTFFPFIAKPAASEMEVVVLPVPPFWLVLQYEKVLYRESSSLFVQGMFSPAFPDNETNINTSLYHQHFSLPGKQIKPKRSLHRYHRSGPIVFQRSRGLYKRGSKSIAFVPQRFFLFERTNEGESWCHTQCSHGTGGLGWSLRPLRR